MALTCCSVSEKPCSHLKESVDGFRLGGSAVKHMEWKSRLTQKSLSDFAHVKHRWLREYQTQEGKIQYTIPPLGSLTQANKGKCKTLLAMMMVMLDWKEGDVTTAPALLPGSSSQVPQPNCFSSQAVWNMDPTLYACHTIPNKQQTNITTKQTMQLKLQENVTMYDM